MTITVFLADDNLIVREGVRALLELEADLEVVGSPPTTTSSSPAPRPTEPQVVVTDIRMPPNFQREGIEAAKEVRKRHPGTGVVILSQYDDPDYAISLLAEGAAGYAYLLKDRVAEGDQLARAIREVATGGSMLDPEIVEAALVRRCVPTAACRRARRSCCSRWPQGRPIKAIAVGRKTTPSRCRRRGRGAVRHAGQGRDRRPRPTASTGCGCCSRRSSTARSRARRSAACCRAGWPQVLRARAAGSARPSGSRSPC